MSSLRDARTMLFDSYDDGQIDEDEFVLLYDLNTSKNPVFPYENYDVFELENVDEAECIAEFCVEKAEFLGIPCVFRCDQQTVCDGMEGLCMLLRPLAYPCRYSDLIPRFGRPVPEISMITSKVADFIYMNHGYRITRWNNTLLSPDNLQRYAEAIHSKGAALDNCFRLLMALCVLHVVQILIKDRFTMVIRGFMPLNFSQSPYQMGYLLICMFL